MNKERPAKKPQGKQPKVKPGPAQDHSKPVQASPDFANSPDALHKDADLTMHSSADWLNHNAMQTAQRVNFATYLAKKQGNQTLQRLVTPEIHTNHPAHSTPSIMRQGLLNAAQETSAVQYTQARYDGRSVRIIQILTGSPVTGTFDNASAQAVATFQNTNPPLVVDGKVGPNTLDTMVPERAGAGMHEHAIQLITDFYNLDVTSNTLTVGFDPNLATNFATNFEGNSLRVITVGATAFTSGTTLRNAIRSALAVRAPGFVVVGERPDFLTEEQEKAAVAANRTRFQDRRSILAFQNWAGTALDGILGPDTVERVAEFQSFNGLPPTGIVDEATMRVLFTQLTANNEQNSVIRLIMDFYDMDDFGTLLDIAYDPAVTSNAETGGNNPGPSLVRVGPSGFTQGYEGLVHTIAHELEHVRQRREGIPSRHVREFLGEAIEIMSVNMPEEDAAGVMDDAGRALEHWNAMDAADQTANWARFDEVRTKLRARFNAFTPEEQAAHQATIDGYNAVVPPAAGP